MARPAPPGGTGSASTGGSTGESSGSGFGGSGGGSGVRESSGDAGPGGGGGGGTGATGGALSGGTAGTGGANNTPGGGGNTGIGTAGASGTGSGTTAAGAGGAGGVITTGSLNMGGGGGGAGWTGGGGGGPEDQQNSNDQYSAGGGGGGSSWGLSTASPTFSAVGTTTPTSTCGAKSTAASTGTSNGQPGYGTGDAASGNGNNNGASGTGDAGCPGNLTLTFNGSAPAALDVDRGFAHGRGQRHTCRHNLFGKRSQLHRIRHALLRESPSTRAPGWSRASPPPGLIPSLWRHHQPLRNEQRGQLHSCRECRPPTTSITPATPYRARLGNRITSSTCRFRRGPVRQRRVLAQLRLGDLVDPVRASGHVHFGFDVQGDVLNGVATFSSLVVDTAGSYTLTATPCSISGVSSAVNSNSFTVKPATKTS